MTCLASVWLKRKDGRQVARINNLHAMLDLVSTCIAYLIVAMLSLHTRMLQHGVKGGLIASRK